MDGLNTKQKEQTGKRSPLLGSKVPKYDNGDEMEYYLVTPDHDIPFPFADEAQQKKDAKIPQTQLEDRLSQHKVISSKS